MGGFFHDKHGERGEEVVQVEAAGVLLLRLRRAGLRNHCAVGVKQGARRFIQPVFAAAAAGEEDEAVVSHEDLVPDACEQAVAVAGREAVYPALEPGVDRLEVVEVKLRHLRGDDLEKIAFCLCALHTAAGRPDALQGHHPPAVCSLFAVLAEWVGQQVYGLIMGSLVGVAVPVEEPSDSVGDRFWHSPRRSMIRARV